MYTTDTAGDIQMLIWICLQKARNVEDKNDSNKIAATSPETSGNIKLAVQYNGVLFS